MKDLEEQNIIRRHLLGGLGEEERERFEEQVLADPEYKERVSMEEDELIEDFVAGEMSDDERERFVKHFLSTPHQLQRLELAKAAHAYFAGPSAPATSPAVKEPARASKRARGPAAPRREGRRLSTARAATALAVVLVGTIALLAWLYLPGQPEDPQAALRQKLARLNDPRHRDEELLRNSPTFKVSLTGDFVRSVEGMPRVPVPAEAKTVQLELSHARHQSYQATLRTVEGEEIFTFPSLATSAGDGGSRLVINVPIELLPRGDYELNLIGVGGDGKPPAADAYYFRVTR
jgi:hypothetical protein